MHTYAVGLTHNLDRYAKTYKHTGARRPALVPPPRSLATFQAEVSAAAGASPVLQTGP